MSNEPQRRVNIIQGEYHLTSDKNVVLTTILGSCVAACLHDPTNCVGGMNHFLLPGDLTEAGGDATEQMRYGVHAMELLINGLLQQGARRDHLQAKLFGGGRMLEGLTDIGNQNAAFAERFLAQEHIQLVGGSLRGDRGRRIQFKPSSGRARQILLENKNLDGFPAERRPVMLAADAGDLDLF